MLELMVIGFHYVSNQGGLADENKLLNLPIPYTKGFILLSNHTTGQSVTVETAIKPNNLQSATIVTSTPTMDGRAYWGSFGV